MVDGEALLVALADFGEDVDPGLGLHTVVGLDIQSSLRLDHLKHLGRPQLGSERPPGKVSCLGHEGPQCRCGQAWEGPDRLGGRRGKDWTGPGTAEGGSGQAWGAVEHTKGFLLLLKLRAISFPPGDLGLTGLSWVTPGQPGQGTLCPGVSGSSIPKAKE